MAEEQQRTVDWAKVKRFWQDYQENILLVIALFVLAIGLLQGKRQGVFSKLERQTYDQLLRQQPTLPSDDRLVVVEISEEDLREQEQWPFSDEIYAQVLENIQASNPAIVGLDVYRDFPVEPGHERLVKQLQQPNLIAIRNLDILAGTPAPPSVRPDQIGFNDLPLDPDGILRRSILYATGSDSLTLPSFSLLVAIAYLGSEENIVPESSPLDPRYLRLGQADFLPIQANSGGYQKIDARGYQMLFHYRDRSQTLNQVSFSDVLVQNFDPAIFNGKIVLLGSTAPSLKDVFLTPFTLGSLDGDKMSGVVAHGQIISYILDTALGERQMFQFWPEWQESLWMMAWLVTGVGLGWKFRHPGLIAICFVGGSGIIWAVSFSLLGGFVWIPVAAPITSFVMGMGLVIVYQSYQDFRQQQMVMTLLGQNTSPAIADALWEERSQLLTSGNLPGRSLVATMLFLDIRGFSTIAETMEPSDLLTLLNELLEMVTHEVQGRNGIINKFTGDGIVAIFGVPMPRETPEAIAKDAQDCISTSVAIAEFLDRINQTCSQKNLPKFKVRIGIFTGEVVAGSLGGKDRMEYGVIGDSVNIASRLESCAKERHPVDCRILIAGSTKQYLYEKFALEAWGPMPLKGKSEVVEVFRVLTPKEKGFLGVVSQTTL